MGSDLAVVACKWEGSRARVGEGDFQQLPPPIQNCEDEDIRRSKFFNAQAVLEMQGQHRCLDPAFTSFKRGGPLVEAIRGIIVECTRCYALQH